MMLTLTLSLYVHCITIKQTSRYKYYALYSWGLPLVVVALTILMQFLPDSVTSGSILPYIGKQSCFFKGDLSTLVYLHIIAGLKVRLHRFILDLTT